MKKIQNSVFPSGLPKFMWSFIERKPSTVLNTFTCKIKNENETRKSRKGLSNDEVLWIAARIRNYFSWFSTNCFFSVISTTENSDKHDLLTCLLWTLLRIYSRQLNFQWFIQLSGHVSQRSSGKTVWNAKPGHTNQEVIKSEALSTLSFASFEIMRTEHSTKLTRQYNSFHEVTFFL